MAGLNGLQALDAKLILTAVGHISLDVSLNKGMSDAYCIHGNHNTRVMNSPHAPLLMCNPFKKQTTES